MFDIMILAQLMFFVLFFKTSICSEFGVFGCSSELLLLSRTRFSVVGIFIAI